MGYFLFAPQFGQNVEVCGIRALQYSQFIITTSFVIVSFCIDGLSFSFSTCLSIISMHACKRIIEDHFTPDEEFILAFFFFSSSNAVLNPASKFFIDFSFVPSKKQFYTEPWIQTIQALNIPQIPTVQIAENHDGRAIFQKAFDEVATDKTTSAHN
jgi:hypothetical protein